MSLQVIILAAGLGKRMGSNKPKVLHEIAGKPMLHHVLDVAQSLNPDQIHIIYGHQGEQVMQQTKDYDNLNWVEQKERLGTGHAVIQALTHLPEQSKLLILSGDVPLIRPQSLEPLLNTKHGVSLLLAHFDNPYGLGRIIRDDKQQIIGIIEERDANPQQQQIQEIYSGILSVDAKHLHRWLPKLSNDNAQGEYYLTEIIAMAIDDGIAVDGTQVSDNIEVCGVNNKVQLHQLERAYQQRQAISLLEQGVCLMDANRIDVRGTLTCGKDVTIDVNCVFEGHVELADGVHIEPHCIIKNALIGAHSRVLANSVIEDSEIAGSCNIGPFARLRPGTKLESGCKVGNFVEMKKTHMHENAKASHLSYVGDASVGRDVNIGAGTITCNYDGINKHQTTIKEGAFIGSGTQLVAPVEIGAHAVIGAGSTIRKDAPDNELTLSDKSQKTVYGWQRKKG